MRGSNRKCTESDMQIQFFSWIRRLALLDERFHLVYSVPNEGAQSETRRLKMYRMGLTRGVSDINVDLPSHDNRFGYLRIELKTASGVQSSDQKEYQRLVNQYGGGLYVLCRSMSEVLDVFGKYFGPCYDWVGLYARYGVVDRRPSSLKRSLKNGMDSMLEDFN